VSADFLNEKFELIRTKLESQRLNESFVYVKPTMTTMATMTDSIDANSVLCTDHYCVDYLLPDLVNESNVNSTRCLFSLFISNL
jgi:hypothetical protein